MEKIIADGKTFGCHIIPRFGKVYVEIYYTTENFKDEIYCASREFGSIFKYLSDEDYEKGREWGLNQLKQIGQANK